MVHQLIALQDVVHASLWQLADPKDHKCPIIGQTWLNEKVAQIKARAAEKVQRKPPMAIVSVSRGGKKSVARANQRIKEPRHCRHLCVFQ